MDKWKLFEVERLDLKKLFVKDLREIRDMLYHNWKDTKTSHLKDRFGEMHSRVISELVTRHIKGQG